MEHKLTNNAERSLASLYRIYMARKNGGEKSADAVKFDPFAHSEVIKLIADDISELKNAGFISKSVTGIITLKSEGIIYCENLPVDKLKEVASFIAKFIPQNPFN